MAGASSENTTPHPPGNGWQPPPKQGLRKFKTLSAAIVSILNLENRFMLLSASMSETALVKVAGTYITCMWPDKHQNYFTGTLGVDRRSIKTFFKDPSRLNVFQQIRTVDRISSRFQITFLSQTLFNDFYFSNFDQSCGFLLVFAMAGQKIQVFCRSTDLVWRVGAYQKARNWTLLKHFDCRELAEGPPGADRELVYPCEETWWEQYCCP